MSSNFNLSKYEKIHKDFGEPVFWKSSVKEFILRTHLNLLCVESGELTIEEALKRFRDDAGDKLVILDKNGCGKIIASGNKYKDDIDDELHCGDILNKEIQLCDDCKGLISDDHSIFCNNKRDTYKMMCNNCGMITSQCYICEDCKKERR